MDPNQPARQRLRLTFAKKKAIKYIGHLDLSLAWERALRRAKIPLAYSQGYNPRPKIQFATTLPLGSTGQAELLDIILNEARPPTDVLDRVRAKLPMGIGLHHVAEVPYKSPAMQTLVRQADYRVTVETELSAAELRERVAALLQAEQIMETRRRKKRQEEIDIRPWIHQLRLESLAEGDALFHMRLTTGQYGNLRPEHVLKAMGLADNWSEYDRQRLYFEDEIQAQ